MARGSEPVISQVFVVPRDASLDTAELNKKMFLLRKLATHNIPAPGVRLELLTNIRDSFHFHEVKEKVQVALLTNIVKTYTLKVG